MNKKMTFVCVQILFGPLDMYSW